MIIGMPSYLSMRPRGRDAVNSSGIYVSGSQSRLDSWDVEYDALVQQPGDLIVTCPGAYQQGWNAGPNIAEAVNYGDDMTQSRSENYIACFAGCGSAAGHKPVTLTWTKNRSDQTDRD